MLLFLVSCKALFWFHSAWNAAQAARRKLASATWTKMTNCCIQKKMRQISTFKYQLFGEFLLLPVCKSPTHFENRGCLFSIKSHCFKHGFSPNSLLWGSLLEEKRLAAICSGRVPGACPPWVRHLSALCPPWFRFGPASTLCPPCVRLVSTACPPCVRLGSALAAPPNIVRFLCLPRVCPPCVRSLSAAMCPLFASSGQPCVLASRLCPLVACCRGIMKKNFSQHCTTHRIYIACPLVIFLGILVPQISAFASAPYA